MRNTLISLAVLAGIAAACWAYRDVESPSAPPVDQKYAAPQWGPDHVEPTYPDEVPAFVGPMKPTEADLGPHSPQN